MLEPDGIESALEGWFGTDRNRWVAVCCFAAIMFVSAGWYWVDMSYYELPYELRYGFMANIESDSRIRLFARLVFLLVPIYVLPGLAGTIGFFNLRHRARLVFYALTVLCGWLVARTAEPVIRLIPHAHAVMPQSGFKYPTISIVASALAYGVPLVLLSRTRLRGAIAWLLRAACATLVAGSLCASTVIFRLTSFVGAAGALAFAVAAICASVLIANVWGYDPLADADFA